MFPFVLGWFLIQVLIYHLLINVRFYILRMLLAVKNQHLLLLLLVRQMEIPVSPMKVAVHRRSLRLEPTPKFEFFKGWGEWGKDFKKVYIHLGRHGTKIEWYESGIRETIILQVRFPAVVCAVASLMLEPMKMPPS